MKINQLINYFGDNNTKVLNLKTNSICDVDGFYKNKILLRPKIENNKFVINSDNSIEINYIKPILFPLKSIIEEIETEFGKEIPIIEMAKIANCFFLDNSVEKLTFLEKDTAILRMYIKKDLTLDFEVDLDDIFGFDAYCYEQDKNILISKPHEIINYLYSRHIAFNINEKEYLNVLEIPNNPYKI